jgi:hypothetical protein
MRLSTVFLLALLTAVSATAQEPTSPTPLNLPISFDKIRDGLLQTQPAEPLKGLTPAEQPTFRVHITEQQKFEDLIAKIKYDPPGPQVAGGSAYYDQYQRLFPRINNPLVQPYAAFTGGEMATLAVEALIEKYIVEKMAHVVGGTLRAQAEREAREEVARAMAAYWASQSAAAPPAAPLPRE